MSRKPRSRAQQVQKPQAPNRLMTAVGLPNLVIGLILAATFAVFANSISNGFAYDDTTQILQNQSLRSLSNIPLILTKESWFWRVEQDKDPNKDLRPTTPYYRPIVMLYLMMGWQLFGTWAAGYHVLNILVHLLSVYFAFLILQRITGDLRLSAVATLLFALHPLRAVH
jgi:hypothetical protein